MVGVAKLFRMNGSLVGGTHLDASYTTLTINLTVGLDGSMIVLVMVILSIFHPGRLMAQDTRTTKLSSPSVVEMWSKGG
jgi:hypothetical protein